LREIRKPTRSATLREWFRPRKWIPALGAVTAVIAVVVLRTQTSIAPLAAPSETLANMDSQDYELIADLDDLLTSDDNNSLDESVLL